MTTLEILKHLLETEAATRDKGWVEYHPALKHNFKKAGIIKSVTVREYGTPRTYTKWIYEGIVNHDLAKKI